MRGEYTRVGAKVNNNRSKSPYRPGLEPGLGPPQVSSSSSSSSSSLPLTPVPLYLRIVATISSWLSLAGYTLYALIFTSARDNVRLSHRAIVTLAAVLLSAGYLGAAVTLVLSRRALRVQYNVVLLPFLLTSVGGLIEIVLNHSLHESFPVGKASAYIYGPLVTASLSTIAFGLLSFMAYWQMRGERQRRQRRQQQQALIQPVDISISNQYDNTTPARENSRSFRSSGGGGSDEAGAGAGAGGTSPLLREDSTAIHLNHISSNSNSGSNYNYNNYASSSSRPYARYEIPHLSPGPSTTAPIAADINDMIPSDEAQRRQLLRLLLAQEQDSRQDAASSSTYHIDWPGGGGGGDDDDVSPSSQRQLPLQSAEQLPRNLSVPDFAATAAAGSPLSMPRRSSESRTSISNQWDMGNLLGKGEGGGEAKRR